jgi:hypothetical protein
LRLGVVLLLLSFYVPLLEFNIRPIEDSKWEACQNVQYA